MVEISNAAEQMMCENIRFYNVFDNPIRAKLCQTPELVWQIGHKTMVPIEILILKNDIHHFRCCNLLHYMTPTEVINFFKFFRSIKYPSSRSLTFSIHVISPLSPTVTKTIFHNLYDFQKLTKYPFPGYSQLETINGCVTSVSSPSNDRLQPGRSVIRRDGTSESYPEFVKSNKSKILDLTNQRHVTRMFNISPDVLTQIVESLGGTIQFTTTYINPCSCSCVCVCAVSAVVTTYAMVKFDVVVL